MKTNTTRFFLTIFLLTVSFAPAVAQSAKPHCESNPAYRQFDFWIGEWLVENAAGKKAGENKISRQEGGCLLREEWISAGGSTGQSINYYDPSEKSWNQTWIDSNGNVAYFKGGLEDGVMVLKGKWINKDGSHYLLNGSWTKLEDGRVRQLFEQSKDDGKTWTTWFDGYYTRK